MAALTAVPLRIICADWSKQPKKRAAYEALAATRVVRRVRADRHDVASLLARACDGGVPTIVAFDAPLGVPESFLRATGASSFVSWMTRATLASCASHDAWCVDAPFFAVPKGRGSLARFRDAAGRVGVDLVRDIERRTNGKPAFVTSGIPGSVGSATRDLWSGLAAARRAGVPFRLWPFEGTDAHPAAEVPVVAETYPRAAYATALVDDPPRARMRVAKTDRATRAAAVAALRGARWVRDRRVTLEDLGPAAEGKDDFDAMITSAALLRCVLEALPLHATPLRLPEVEGAILGTGSIDLALPEVTFRPRLHAPHAV